MQAHDIKEEQALQLEQDDQHEADVYMEEPEQNQEGSENEHAQEGDGQDYCDEYKEEAEDGNGYQDSIHGDLGAEGDAGRADCILSSNDRGFANCVTPQGHLMPALHTRLPHVARSSHGRLAETASCTCCAPCEVESPS